MPLQTVKYGKSVDFNNNYIQVIPSTTSDRLIV